LRFRFFPRFKQARRSYFFAVERINEGFTQGSIRTDFRGLNFKSNNRRLKTMAHNLATIEGKTAFFCATGKHGSAWHKLGQEVRDAQSWQEAMRLAKLDWTVSKRPLYAKFPDGEFEMVPTWGIFRDSDEQFFGAVGNQYEPIQNQFAFDFVDTLLEAEAGSHYESAGALGNGSRVFCLARVPFDFSIGGTDDKHETYMLFTSSHDGTGAATAMLTDTRVVCQNTLNMALSRKENSGILKVKHTKSAEIRLDQARKLMSGIKSDVATLRAKLDLLASRQMTEEALTAVMDRLYPVVNSEVATRRKNKIAEIATLYFNNDNNAFPEVRGTAYNLLNAITEHTDHKRGVRMTDSRSGMTEEQARADNALFGSGSDLKQNALEVILDATNGLPIRTIVRTLVSVPSMPVAQGVLVS
jgi:phage/plasmid-like protein (TIGR03299 family)